VTVIKQVIYRIVS